MSGAGPGQQSIVTERELEAMVPQRADRTADIVADSVGGVNQCVVPVGVEQRGECMRGVMIRKKYARLRPKAVRGKELGGPEKT